MDGTLLFLLSTRGGGSSSYPSVGARSGSDWSVILGKVVNRRGNLVHI